MKTLKVPNAKIMTMSILSVALFTSTPLMAIEKGDILLNVRILNVSPDIGSNQVILTGGAPLAPPAGIDVDDAYSLGLDITYMMTNNFGIELMLDTSSKHDISGTGNLAGVDIGEINVLPPSLIAIWHFSPKSNVRPYVGAGINYTIFFDGSTTDQFTGALGAATSDVSVDDGFGLIAQVGVDIDISKKWYLSLDAKYIDLDTTATIEANGADAATVDFDVNPLVLGVGIGTTF